MIDTNEIVIGGIGILTTIVSAWVSWFFARKKYNSEVDHNYIENLSDGLKTYDSIISHNKAEIEYLMKDNEELRAEVSELRKQVLNLTLNICMDLTCARRIREHQVTSMGRNGRNISKLNETESVNAKD